MIAGLPAGLTAYGGTQLADRYRAVVVGAGRNLGDWGAVSVDVTHARSQLADDSTHQGQSLRFLYAKSLNNYGTNFQLLGYRYSTRGFYTWMMWHTAVWKGTTTNTIATDAAIKCRWRRATTISATAKRPLSGQYFAKSGDYGSLYLSGSQQNYWNTPDTNTVSTGIRQWMARHKLFAVMVVERVGGDLRRRPHSGIQYVRSV